MEIPTNVKIENTKEVEMRKSLYKFGDSFTSTFQKKKKELASEEAEKQEKQEKQK